MKDLLTLTSVEEALLENILKTHPKPYMRERASALLKVASGMKVSDVAAHGLLQKRRINTVYEWIRNFKELGLESLTIQPGRGRKPAFFP